MHCMYVLRASLTLSFMSSIKIFQVGLLHLISLQYRLSFTDFSLGDVDLCFSLKLERKANADEEETI